VAERPYDTSRVMAMLKPPGRKKARANILVENEGESDNVFNDVDEDEESSEEEIDLANFGTNKATDIFILKFLLCSGDKVQKGDGSQAVDSKEDEEEDYTITDKETAKKYAMTSYLKLLTARVLRLEEDMARQKKVSLIMVGNGGNGKTRAGGS